MVKVKKHTKVIELDKISIYKSELPSFRKNPYIVKKGDISASFKTLKEAKKFAKDKMPYYYISSITGRIGKI